jgi:hypothetical protein
MPKVLWFYKDDLLEEWIEDPIYVRDTLQLFDDWLW